VIMRNLTGALLIAAAALGTGKGGQTGCSPQSVRSSRGIVPSVPGFPRPGFPPYWPQLGVAKCHFPSVTETGSALCVGSVLSWASFSLVCALPPLPPRKPSPLCSVASSVPMAQSDPSKTYMSG
jgi:hypothetical protein